MLSISSAELESKLIGSNAPECSQSVGRDRRVRGDASLEQLCWEGGPQQTVPTLLTRVPASHTSSAATVFRMQPGCSVQPSSTVLFPEESSALITVEASLFTASQFTANSPRLPSPEEVLRFFPSRARHHMGGMSVTPVILLRLDVRQPLLAVPPPGGWSGEAAMAMAAEEVRIAAAEEQEGESGAANVKHSTARRRTMAESTVQKVVRMQPSSVALHD